jgi:antitoxin component of MazEF toxin-antitoxin module
MIQRIYERSVIQMGYKPKHSFMVTIPRKICESLQIEKGTRLYFKLEGNRFVVSNDIKSLDDIICKDSDSVATIESTKTKKEDKEDIIVDGISLADLRY